MAANGREIPGFYFDPEKGKYFKIEKNHVAIPSSKYSQQSVSTIREETRKRKRADKTKRTREQQTLRRCKALQHPLLAGTAIDRELGVTRTASLFPRRSSAFIENLKRQVCVDLQRRRALGLYKPEISCFDYDAATGGLLIGASDRLGQGTVMSLIPIANNADNGPTPHQKPTENHLDVRALMAVKSDISSVNIAPSRAVVITSQGGNNTPPIVHLTRLLDPAEAENESIPVDSGMSMQFRHPDITTIWCSAPNPWETSGNDQIAIGTQTSVINIHGSGHWQTHPAIRTDSDVLALSWIAPHTLAAGLRSAEVRLWDSRSNGTSLRLRHRGVVTGIKSAGSEAQIVVDGLRSSLCMYDLRMVRAPKKTGSRPSKALIEFASEDHQEMYPTGFDVNPELGIVIAAGDKDWLSAYSLRSGKRLERWRISNELSLDPSKREEGVTKCARFVETQQGAPEIMASFNSRIVKFAW